MPEVRERSMFQRRHYKALAKVIKDAGKAGYISSARVMGEKIATMLEIEGDRFDRAKFLQACGLEGTVS
jgi:hypothetical protein